MAKEWIEKLAEDIKTKEHKPAEEFAKEQRRLEALNRKGRLFYDELFKTLASDIAELNLALSGDVTGSTITIGPVPSAHNVNFNITRPNFPKVTAAIRYSRDNIVFAYTQQNGVQMSVQYTFHVGENEGVSVKEAFGESAKHFNHPAELAKHIMELLFRPA